MDSLIDLNQTHGSVQMENLTSDHFPAGNQTLTQILYPNQTLQLDPAENQTLDHFQDLYRPRTSRTVFLLVSAFGSALALVLIYSIIWFEKYGSDHKRTIQTQLVASACWCGCFWFVIIQPINTLRYLYGPLPLPVCRMNQYFKLCFTSQLYLLFVSVSISRYVYIFCLKNPAAFKDEFWSKLISIGTAFLCSTVHFVCFFMLGQDPFVVAICSGSDPRAIQHPGPLWGMISFNRVLLYCTVTIYFAIAVKIRIYKCKNYEVNSQVDSKSFGDFKTNFISATCIIASVLLPKLLTVKDPLELNNFPNYLIEYFNSLLLAPVFAFLLVLLYFVRYNELRQTIFREFNNFCLNVQYFVTSTIGIH